jgi:putative ATPase
MDDLFGHSPKSPGDGAKRGARPDAPLAERMRPQTLDEVVGQDHLLAEGGFLRKALRLPALPSLLFWGPPGAGKTTLAKLLATEHGDHFIALSAVLSGVKELREAIDEAKRIGKSGQRTTLFVDEIHRFNKGQQDALLPHVEQGTITFIGATTENPSFEVNAALLSRSRVLALKPLDDAALRTIFTRATTDPDRGLGKSGVHLSEEGMQALMQLSSGDARRALNALEMAFASAQAGASVGREEVETAFQTRASYHDASGDLHFDLASALIKSMRGSDPDAALYYLARMLDGGEDPMFIARRLVIFASEDVGNADPTGIILASSIRDAVHFVGMPEAAISLAQAVTYLASTVKSNASYMGLQQAKADVAGKPQYPIPMHIRNAPTKLMKDMGYHKGYVYPHDRDEGVAPEVEYLPDELQGRRYYEPKAVGREAALKERLEGIRKQRDESKK